LCFKIQFNHEKVGGTKNIAWFFLAANYGVVLGFPAVGFLDSSKAVIGFQFAFEIIHQQQGKIEIG